jgi:hypothetical protein
MPPAGWKLKREASVSYLLFALKDTLTAMALSVWGSTRAREFATPLQRVNGGTNSMYFSFARKLRTRQGNGRITLSYLTEMQVTITFGRKSSRRS